MAAERPFWILVRHGQVLWYDDHRQRGVLLIETRDAAEFTAKQLDMGDGVTPVQVGSRPGESLNSLLAYSYERGANGAFIVDSTCHLWSL